MTDLQKAIDSLSSIHQEVKTGISNIKDIDSFMIATHRLAFLLHEDAAPLAVATLTNITLIEKALKIALDYMKDLDRQISVDKQLY